MKRSFNYLRLFFFLLTISSVKAGAQHFELTPFIGYETGGRLYTSRGYIYIEDGIDYGGSLNYPLKHGFQIEASYSHLKSHLDIDEGNNRRSIFDMAVDYYSVGMLKEIKPRENLIPYGSVVIGMVEYRPLTDDYSDENLLQFSFAGGVKKPLSERIGLRFQARFLMPIWSDGHYFKDDLNNDYVETTTRPGAVQFDFTLGLIIKI